MRIKLHLYVYSQGGEDMDSDTKNDPDSILLILIFSSLRTKGEFWG